MKDVACAGYVAGGNTRWFAKNEKHEPVSPRPRRTTCRRASRSPTTTPTATPRCSPSRATRASSRAASSTPSCRVTTRLLPWEVNNAGTARLLPGRRRPVPVYNAALQPRQVHYGEDMKAAENQDFISQGSTNNATCFLGPQPPLRPVYQVVPVRCRAPNRCARPLRPPATTIVRRSLIPGQGHFGPDAIPGVSSSHIQTIALFPYTFTTQLQSRFRCAEQRIGLTCTKHIRAGGAPRP